MLKTFAALLAFLASIGPAHACSLIPFSPEFTPERGSASTPKPIKGLSIKSLDFVAGLPAGDSCEGVGWLGVRLDSAHWSSRRMRQHGFIIRPVSGVNGTNPFPRYPLTVARHVGSHDTLFWGWTGITPDADGHVRWRLEVVPVSPSGVHGEAVPFCVSSDNSCPGASKRPKRR